MNNLVHWVTKRALMIIAVALLVTLSTPGAKAACHPGGSVQSASFLRPAHAHLWLGAAASQDEDVEPSIAGLWRTVFVSGGAVATVGFDSKHSDGTEFAYDSLSALSGPYCPGVWEKTGPRTYATVHPAYNYDANGNPNGIFIERVHLKLSEDGNSYAGTFTWDCYDFKGNLQTSGPLACSIAGTVAATRITVDGPFPFPFPL